MVKIVAQVTKTPLPVYKIIGIMPPPEWNSQPVHPGLPLIKIVKGYAMFKKILPLAAIGLLAGCNGGSGDTESCI